MNALIQQECIKLISSDSKDIYNVTKDFYLNAVLLNILFHQRLLIEFIMVST